MKPRPSTRLRNLFVTACTLAFLLMPPAVLPAPASSPPDAVPKGGRLVIALNSTPAHLNPALHSGTLTDFVGSQIFAGLIRCDRQGRPHPYLAESWEFSNTGKTLTLHLRRNALFHDGTPITSADAAFSLETVRAHHPFVPMLSSVKSVETPDPHTVVIRLHHHHPALLQILTPTLTPILPRHIYGDGRELATHPANWQAVGSGPFRLVSVKPDKRIELKRFDDFFLPGRPYLDALSFELFPGPDEIPMAMESGDVHLTGFSPLAAHHEQLARQKHLGVTTDGLNGIGAMLWLGFNIRRMPFRDHRVRKAFALAIDRDFIAERILRAGAVPMDGPLIPGSPFYIPSEEPVTPDIAEANRLLDAAGFKRNRSGKRMTVQVDYPPNAGALARPLITYLRHRLSRTVGVDLRIRENTDFKDWAKHIATNNFQMNLDIVFTWADPVIGVHRTYHSTNIRRGVTWSNTSGYSNPEVDRILDAAAREPDVSRRKEFYARFQKIVRHDQPIVWLATMPYATVFDRRLRGLNESLWGLLAPLDTVYWAEDSDD